MRITTNNIENVYKSKLVNVETMKLKGYKLINNLFVDSSGFGKEDELAMTQSYFLKELQKYITKYKTIYTTITDAGQFQVYVGIFIRDNEPKDYTTKQIANNTLLVRYNDGSIKIRLHNTDIVKYGIHNGKKCLMLNSGGYRTNTTKRRINEYTNAGIYQRNFEWYLKDGTPFNDNIETNLTLSI